MHVEDRNSSTTCVGGEQQRVILAQRKRSLRLQWVIYTAAAATFRIDCLTVGERSVGGALEART